MSTIPETKTSNNKFIIHIATEIVVICGISFYFYSKNKKLEQKIESLTTLLSEKKENSSESKVNDLGMKLDLLYSQINKNFSAFNERLLKLEKVFSEKTISQPISQTSNNRTPSQRNIKKVTNPDKSKEKSSINKNDIEISEFDYPHTDALQSHIGKSKTEFIDPPRLDKQEQDDDLDLSDIEEQDDDLDKEIEKELDELN
jgi:hypothetical protein